MFVLVCSSVCIYIYFVFVLKCAHLYIYSVRHIISSIMMMFLFIRCMHTALLFPTPPDKHTHTHKHTFLDGYCSIVQGLLDWFEVDLGFTS